MLLKYPARRLSAHIGHMFLEYPLEERVQRAAAAGFGAVEHPNPFDFGVSASRMRELIRAAGVTYTQLATGFGDMERGEMGMACFPGREKEFEDSLKLAVDYAAEVDCRLVHILAGMPPRDVPEADIWRTYIANLRKTSALCRERDMTVLIEFTSELGDPGYLINDHRIALKAIEESGEDNIGVMLDTFHVAAEHNDSATIVRELGSLLKHIHVADFPGRGEPGTGRIDFDQFRIALNAVAYDGTVGFEYDPLGNTEKGLAWIPQWLL